MFRRAGDCLEIRLGLHPDLTGQGLGASFLAAGMRYAETAFQTRRFALAVAAFKCRAITVYQRVGFSGSHRYPHETNGRVHGFVWMILSGLEDWGAGGWLVGARSQLSARRAARRSHSPWR